VDRAVKKVIPLIEMSGEPGWKARRCVSCHSNSLPTNDGRAGPRKRVRRQ